MAICVIIGTMATAQESVLVRIIARIDEQIAEREARMLTSLSAEELHRVVDQLIDLHQSRWEHEETLKSLSPENKPPSVPQ